METMNQYMNGTLEEIPQNESNLQPEVIDVFYLLGDYYFHNKIMVI